jgi:hypothetical protein
MTSSPVMQWLAAGLPITLLCDLADVAGLDSAAINCAERPDTDLLWAERAQAPIVLPQASHA